MQKTARAPLRREELLAFIVERLARGQGCPSQLEMSEALKISETRIRQLVDQLIAKGVVRRTPGSQRNLVICDVTQCRAIVVEALRRAGWASADPVGGFIDPYANAQLPIIAVLGHVPDNSGAPHASSNFGAAS